MKGSHLLVLAGGFGTRLRSVVAEVPKPLAPIGDRPFLHHLMGAWASQGVARMTFLLHHQAPLIESFLASPESLRVLEGRPAATLTEPRPMGTGGAIAYAVRELGLSGSFLVTNADTWLGTGALPVSAEPAPAMAVVKVENTERYGQVRIEGGKVIGFAEKQDTAGPGWINAGMYHLQADLFRAWDGEPFSVERKLFPALAASGRLAAVPLETEFIDIGIPEDYFRFARWIESGKGARL